VQALLSRRGFLNFAVSGVLASAIPLQSIAQSNTNGKFKAVVFDAFPVFDPRPAMALAETVFPGHGQTLSSVWRTRQFDYQWLRALSGQYVDFWKATEDSLVFAAKSMHLELSTEVRDKLMAAYSHLTVWPDAPAALKTLRKAGIRLAFLSNMTRRMLEDGIRQSNLNELFEDVLSTDQIRSYKPDPRTYQMAIDSLKLKHEEILFAPFAGWDAAGAKWFGYPTFWVNRLGGPAEELGVVADGMGPDLNALVKFTLD
jgi:2-haloacid dehalogenase